MEEIKELESLLYEINNNIDDCIENLIFLLEHQELKDINLYNIYLELSELSNNKQMIENKLFILKLNEI